MNTDRELMQQALEALELHAKQYPHMQKGYTVDAITALRERLAQPEQQPVAHTLNCICGAVWDVSPDGVEEMVHAPNQPQRKPLTVEEILDMADGCTAQYHDLLSFARAIEAAHGIKGDA